MVTEDHASRINVRPSVSCPEPAAFPDVEERYRNAKARLSAAQQEKAEAALDFLAARTDLNRWLEAAWPGQEGYQERERAESGDAPARTWFGGETGIISP